MAENWYYVLKGNRHGPVGEDVLLGMIESQELKADDFVWKKGFDNWKKIKDTPELDTAPAREPAPSFVPPASEPLLKPAKEPTAQFNLKTLMGLEDRSIFIRIGNDRGGSPLDYGPFNLAQLKQLFKENRINGKTFIFTQGLKAWRVLGDLPEYQELFEELPPVIKDDDRRTDLRKPFVARLFVQNNKKLFEGICRDISIGGMQVLMTDFNGNAGDKITINVHPENSDYHFVASGVVVRMLEGNSGFSFRFQGLGDEARKVIEKYVSEN